MADQIAASRVETRCAPCLLSAKKSTSSATTTTAAERDHRRGVPIDTADPFQGRPARRGARGSHPCWSCRPASAPDAVTGKRNERAGSPAAVLTMPQDADGRRLDYSPSEVDRSYSVSS